jgi:hypothetical protein
MSLLVTAFVIMSLSLPVDFSTPFNSRDVAGTGF